MKFRTFLLFVCMIVVPLLAMFSHKVPPEIRTACSDLLLRPAIDLIEAAAGSTELKPTPPPVDFAAPHAGPLLAASHPTASTETIRLPTNHAGDAQRPQVTTSEATLRAGGSPDSASQLPPAESIDSVLPASSRLDSKGLRHQLAAAGVHRLILEPSTDGSGQFHGSCRVAVDPNGELQRLFHTHASSETEALQQLLEQVNRWQQRLAKAPGAGQPTGAVLR